MMAALNSGLFNASAATSPQPVLEVRGGGDAPGRGPEARQNAVTNARNRLLIDHLEFWGDSSQLARLAPILERSQHYFRNVRVLKHEPDNEGTHVEITAELLVSALRKDVGDLILSGLDRKPTAIVIVQDDFGEEAVSSMFEPGAAENRIRKILHDAGFNVVDSNRLRDALTPKELVDCVAGAEAVAAEAARILFADVAIVGRATASVAEDTRVTNLFRNRGSVALRIVRAADDVIAEEVHATGIVESRDPADGAPMAVEDACDKLADSLASGIVMAVLFTPSDDAVKLSLVGEPAEGSRDDVIVWLAHQNNVDAVEIVGDEEGMVRLRVDYKGSMSDLVALLEDTANLEITRVLDRDITAEFLSRGRAER